MLYLVGIRMPGLALRAASCCITVSHVLYFRSEVGARVVSHQVEHVCISHEGVQLELALAHVSFAHLGSL